MPCSEPSFPMFIGRSAWRREDLASGDWVYELSSSEIDALIVAAERTVRAGLDVCEITKDVFEIPALDVRLKTLREEIENGRGMVLLRGLPVQELGERLATRIFWGFGSHLGVAVPQSARDDIIGRVEDLGNDSSLPTTRGYQSNIALPFHTDRSDLVLLLCMRSALEGGETSVVSGVSAHNVIRQTRPDVLARLYDDFFWDLRGGERARQRGWTKHPIYCCVEGKCVVRYVRRFIESSARFSECPPLSSLQVQALDYFDTVLNGSELRVDYFLAPGDIQVLNNHVVLHARRRFLDSPERPKKRLLLRLWLACSNSRRLPASFRGVFGCTFGGVLRGGVGDWSGVKRRDVCPPDD